MENHDLDTYVLAKRELRRATIITILSLALAAGTGALLLFGIAGPFAKGCFYGSLLAIVLVNSEFGPYSVLISKSALLGIIERQISRDARALGYVAHRG